MEYLSSRNYSGQISYNSGSGNQPILNENNQTILNERGSQTITNSSSNDQTITNSSSNDQTISSSNVQTILNGRNSQTRTNLSSNKTVLNEKGKKRIVKSNKLNETFTNSELRKELNSTEKEVDSSENKNTIEEPTINNYKKKCWLNEIKTLHKNACFPSSHRITPNFVEDFPVDLNNSYISLRVNQQITGIDIIR